MEQIPTYTYGEHVEIWTDHAPHRYLESIRSFSTRIQRLKSKLIDFDYVIKYRKGKLNQVCDAMSRYPVDEPSLTIKDNTQNIILPITQINKINMQIIQANDMFLTNIIQAINNPELTNHIWLRKSKNYFFNDENVLLNNWKIKNTKRIVVALPKVLIKETLANFYDHPFFAHLGVAKTYKKIAERYYWPGMYKEIKNYVTSCTSCQKRKTDNTPTYGLMQSPPKITGRPFEHFTIDYIGPINPSSNNYSYILVGTCATTKYALSKACKHADNKTTVTFLSFRNYFSIWSY